MSSSFGCVNEDSPQVSGIFDPACERVAANRLRKQRRTDADNLRCRILVVHAQVVRDELPRRHEVIREQDDELAGGLPDSAVPGRGSTAFHGEPPDPKAPLAGERHSGCGRQLVFEIHDDHVEIVEARRLLLEGVEGGNQVGFDERRR